MSEEKAAQLEEVKTQDFFDINNTSPLVLAQFDKLEDCEIIREIPQTYPLYLILKLFNSLISNPAQQKTLSLETIYQVCDLTLQKLKKSNGGKWVLDKKDSHYWMEDFRLINEYLSALIAENNAFKQQLLDIVMRTGFAIEKNVRIKSGENRFKNFIGASVAETVITLGKLYFKAGQFHLTEAYCLKYLAHLETLPKDDRLIDLNKRKLLAKALLASIYLKSGNSQVAVDFFKTTYNTLDRYYNIEFNSVLPDFWELYRDTLYHFFQNKDFLKVLDLYQSFLKDYTLIDTRNSKYSKIDQKMHSLKYEVVEKVKNDIKLIEKLFAQAKQKYKNEFNEKVNNSPLLKDRVSQSEFDFDKNKLTLKLKNSDLNLSLQQAFKVKGIKYTSQLDNQFVVSINQCPIKLLERVCQHALSLQEEHLARQAQKEQMRKSEIVYRSTVNNHPESVSETSIFSAHVISQPEKISSTLAVQNKRKKNNNKKKQQPSAKNAMPRPPLSKTEAPRIRHQWPCGLAYDSIDNNEGYVKHLTNTFLPDDLWFGYIPDWLKQDEHYDKEFERKLIIGFIKKDCIRDIIKELQTKINHNDSVEHPYKFKIVVKNWDYRVYGWIEDVLTDEEGKKHYLVCFGHLGAHDEPLPHPEKIKKKFSIEKTVPKEEQFNLNDMVEPFIERLMTVIYNDNIPVEMKNGFQGLINSLYNCAKIFGEKGLTLEQATILFASFEKMCDQIVELGKMELGSKEQLGVVKNMIDLLFGLNEEKMYQPIISPLLKVVKHVENYYFVNELKPRQPVQEVISEESSDDMLAAQLIKRMYEKTERITGNADKFEKIGLDQQQINKTQFSPILHKQPSPRKDVDVIETINPDAGEPKLQF